MNHSAASASTRARWTTTTPRRGHLVAIEGGEGAGKSTLAAALESRFRSLGLEVVRTHEPGGTQLGDVVSQLIRRGRLARRVLAPYADPERWSDIDPLAELLLFSAARAQSVRDILRPALSRGAVVITDRYVASTLAYQGYGRGLPIEDIEAVSRIATGGLEPDLTVLLDLPPAIGLRRATTDPSGDRLRGEPLAFHERVRAGYLKLAAQDRDSWLVVDATLEPEKVVEAAWQRIAALP